MKKMIGIFGGTFDPIHDGHLRSALELYQQLLFDEMRFVPCQIPVLKSAAQATAQQRVEMLQLAIKDQPGFVIDECELQRATPSYMFDTLTEMRKKFNDAALCLIMGSDSFNELPRWHRWQDLLQLSHLIVMARPDHVLTIQDPLTNFLQEHRTTDPAQLHENNFGKILFVELTAMAISATKIRDQMVNDLSPRYLLPEAVWQYIQKHHIYRKN